jgi:hypothetical protein
MANKSIDDIAVNDMGDKKGNSLYTLPDSKKAAAGLGQVRGRDLHVQVVQTAAYIGECRTEVSKLSSARLHGTNSAEPSGHAATTGGEHLKPHVGTIGKEEFGSASMLLGIYRMRCLEEHVSQLIRGR